MQMATKGMRKSFAQRDFSMLEISIAHLHRTEHSQLGDVVHDLRQVQVEDAADASGRSIAVGRGSSSCLISVHSGLQVTVQNRSGRPKRRTMPMASCTPKEVVYETGGGSGAAQVPAQRLHDIHDLEHIGAALQTPRTRV